MREKAYSRASSADGDHGRVFLDRAGRGRRFIVVWALGALAGASALWAVPYALVLLLGGFDGATAAVMPEVLVIASGASLAVVALVTGIAWHLTYRDADRAGTRLRIDARGVYLGGRRPRLLPWADVREVVLLTHTVSGEYGDHVSHVVVFPRGGPVLSRRSPAFSRRDPVFSRRDPVFSRGGRVRSANPFDWGPHRELVESGAPFPSVRRAVAAHRPDLAVEDLGDVPFHHRTRFHPFR